ncbi:hypothetical protein [Bacillus sp. S10(2024)]|uniref:hypothetical protein n=1 Tax=Bacillus sp. S10(2024) TaxID=3162886 RepID=UPI003D246471
MKKLRLTVTGLVLIGIIAFNVTTLNKGDTNIGDGGIISNKSVKDPGGFGVISNKSVGDHGGSPSYEHGDTPSPCQQAKVLKYPLNENFLSLQVVTLRSQLIFFRFGAFIFLKLMGLWRYPI